VAIAEVKHDLTADAPGERLDVFVARACDLPRARARRLIEDGLVTREGVALTKPGEKLRGGERLTVTVPPAAPAEPLPEDVPLDIVYEDEHLLVVNKPAGMPVHPGPGHARRTLVNALLAHCPELPGIGGVQRPGIVHRLDKDTSGLIIVAKTEKAHAALSRQLKDREIKKTYLALVEGVVSPPEAQIEAPIGRDPNNRRRMMVRSANGRESTTVYRLRAVYGGRSLVEASPITGRTHQIRVHMASIGHPVVGDPVYGKPSPLVPRQFLHAWRLSFTHPIDGRSLSFEAPLPADLEAALQQLRE
jgi:23S rRNA pseudouridine1911/1915/1917 synthase